MEKKSTYEYERLFWDKTLNGGKGELTIIGQLALMIIAIEIFSTFFYLMVDKRFWKEVKK